jgi:hypothetical protein
MATVLPARNFRFGSGLPVHHAIQNTERPCVISVHGRGYFTLLQRTRFCDFWHWNIIIFLASREIGISSFKRGSGAEIFLEKLLRLRRKWMEETTTCAAEMVFLFFFLKPFWTR